jgi:hypothetical protein
MSTTNKPFFLFLGGCIPIRLALAATAKFLPVAYLPYLGLFTFVIALGFLYLYFTGKRTTGIETQGKPIWWMNFRIVHGLTYLLFSGLAFKRSKNAYIVLLIDALVGLGLFLRHYKYV